MAGSRHLQGNIITRVKHLLKSGSLKEAPLWYDVVRRFPPPSSSLLSLVEEGSQEDVPKITYSVDDIKREFYKTYFRAVRDPESLLENVLTKETKTELFLREYEKYLKESQNHDTALTRAFSSFDAHLKTLRGEKVNYQMDYEDKQNAENDMEDLSVDDIYNLFSDQKKS